jgi:hypothetical protein
MLGRGEMLRPSGPCFRQGISAKGSDYESTGAHPCRLPCRRSASNLAHTARVCNNCGMAPEVLYAAVIAPTLKWMAAQPSIRTPDSDAARILVTTIAGQESRWHDRRQIGGPARSYWQFEQGGGVAGLFLATPRQLSTVCASQDILYDLGVVFEAMAWNDPLACAMARLLLWTDPAPLPAVGDKDAAWAYYIANWRPGAPHRASWDGLYDQSSAIVLNAKETV